MNAVAEAVSAAVKANASNFVTVPEVTLPNGVVVPSFQVGVYFASKGDDGKAAVSATAKPWVRITYFDARKACVAADPAPGAVEIVR